MKTKITTDIYFAALLLAVGAKLEKTDRTDPRHMEFHFSAPETSQGVVASTEGGSVVTTVPGLDLDELENSWINNKYKVSAFDYAEAIKRMKSVVHSRTLETRSYR